MKINIPLNTLHFLPREVYSDHKCILTSSEDDILCNVLDLQEEFDKSFTIALDMHEVAVLLSLKEKTTNLLNSDMKRNFYENCV